MVFHDIYKYNFQLSVILRIRKRQLNCLGRIMRKEGLEKPTLTGHAEHKRDNGKKLNDVI